MGSLIRSIVAHCSHKVRNASYISSWASARFPVTKFKALKSPPCSSAKNAVEAFATVGDLVRARSALETLEAQVRVIEGTCAGAVCERAKATLLLAEGEPLPAADRLAPIADVLESAGHLPDAARARLIRGRALLRAGRRSVAAEALAEAKARFEGMGARLWAERAASDLDRAAPRHSEGELTATEQRVAGLVVEGMKNKEIAGAMFVSVATVEAHLTRTYRKLGIRSRNDLVRLISEGSVDLAPPGTASGTP